MNFEDIKTILIVVELQDGSAHQVLATRENKQLALKILGKLEDGLKLSKDIEPIQITLS